MSADTSMTKGSIRQTGIAVVLCVVGVAAGFFLFSGSGGEEAAPTEDAAKIDEHSLDGLTSVAIGKADLLYLGGRFGVRVLVSERQVARSWPTETPVTALDVDDEGNVYAASRTHVEKFDPNGRRLLKWGRGGCEGDPFRYVSGIACGPDNVFVADSGAQTIYSFSREGVPVRVIADGETEGIRAPSACVDLTVVGDRLLVTNPGQTRVETYDFAGQRRGYWGEGGSRDTQFPGCCNPNNIAVLPDGRIVVSQKGDTCLKIFTDEGKLLALLGRDVFPAEAVGIDLAVDSKGRIYAVDRVANVVRVWESSPNLGWRQVSRIDATQ